MVSATIKQIWSVSGVLLIMFCQGMVFSFSSVLVPVLQQEGPLHASLHMQSWIVSSVGISSILGILMAAYCMERWGRRMAQIITIAPGTAGWALVCIAQDAPTVLAGRVLCGITTGASLSVGAVAIGEYSSPNLRGMFLNLKTASVCMGSTTVHVLGHYVAWKIIAQIALIPTVLALAIIVTWPESPAWLASKHEFEKCEKAFYWLRGKDEKSICELEEMVRAQKRRPAAKKVSLKEKVVDCLAKFKRMDFLWPCCIVFLGSVLLESVGRHVFPAYALLIIGEIVDNKTQSFYYTLALDLIITVSATFSSVLVKLMKRRTLLLGTGVAALGMLAAGCTYLFLSSRGFISKDYQFIPMSMFVVFFVLANLGCTPIPLALLGEVFPLAHRSFGSLVGGLLISFNFYICLQITPFLLRNIKVYGTFTVFGGLIGLALLGLYFILPETKDKTLQEIEDHFNRSLRNDTEDATDEADVKMINRNEIRIV